MFHAKHLDIRNIGNMVIRANDTDIEDIAIILAYNASILENTTIWYNSGNDHDNSRKYTNKY